MTSTAWAGTGALCRLAFATERRWILGTFVVFLGTYVATAAQIRQIAPTVGDRVGLQGTIAQTPGFRVLLGPFEHTAEIGGATLWRVGVFMLAVAGMLAAACVVRQTRRAEEQGQAELVGATAVGRLAPLAAGLVTAAALTVAAALGVAGGLVLGAGSGATDAAAAGAQVVVVGLATAGLAAVAAQLAQAARSALGMTAGVLLAAYAVRGAADVRHSDAVQWLTPFGWAAQVDPFGEDRWYPLGVAALATASLVALAVVLRGRRDVGAGLIAPGPGRPDGPRLGAPIPLTLRLERRAGVVWLVGLAAFGVFVGSLVPTVVRLGSAEGGLAEALRRLGGAGALTDVFVSAMASIGALVVTSWGVAVVTRHHADEAGGRLEQLLAAAVSRRAVLLAPAVVAVAGVLPALAVTGLAIGLSGGDLGDALAASVVQAPAVWVVIAIAVLGQALGGRWTAMAWGGVVVATAVGQIGAAVGLPEWAQQASPFTHVPGVPADPFTLAPELVLSAVAALLLVASVLVVHRRDVPR
ncbi:hypothetical protein [Aeromicrobium sp. Leaf350]|uniref:hypothetical protein n=1 Tax=Aeromicrobium sp. Leaf350 TaxID=2876565 RepID=UPI001E3015F6|nr:hypothetical protein [Aeromicrobium sp. Leaf350]